MNDELKEELEDVIKELQLDPDIAEHAEEVAEALHELGVELTEE
jgi:hypothetical protein